MKTLRHAEAEKGVCSFCAFLHAVLTFIFLIERRIAFEMDLCSIQPVQLFASVNSTVRNVDGKAAKRGFLVLLAHVFSGLAHGFNRAVEWDEMLTIAPQRQRRC